jgi:hypothetical protein
MPKTLLKRAIDAKIVSSQSTMRPELYNGVWGKITRPKNTVCPFGSTHKSNRNISIRDEDGNALLIRCWGKSCRGKFKTVESEPYTDEELKEFEKMEPLYSYDDDDF